MQNIYAILAKYNLTIPEDKKAEFEEAVKANYKTVAEVEKITSAGDNKKISTALIRADYWLLYKGRHAGRPLRYFIRDDTQVVPYAFTALRRCRTSQAPLRLLQSNLQGRRR